MRSKFLGWFFLVVSFLGWLDATYLVIKHYQGVTPPCTLLHGCEIVTTSAYSILWGIPLALYGAVYYLLVFVLSIIYLETGNARLLRLAGRFTVIGFLASLYFVYLQLFVIEAICVYCLGSATTSTLLFVAGFFGGAANKSDTKTSMSQTPQS